LATSGVPSSVVSVVATESDVGSLSSAALVIAPFINGDAPAAMSAAGCSVGTRIPGGSQGADDAGAGVSASVTVLVAATVFDGLPAFVMLAAVATVLTAIARLAALVVGAAGAGIRVGGVTAGGMAMGAAGGCGVGAATVGGCVAGAEVGGNASGSGTLGVSRAFGAVGVDVLGVVPVAGVTTGAVARSAAGGAAPALPVVAEGARLAGAVGAGDGACAPNPASTERKSPASALGAESGAPEFERAVLALELAAPFALTVAKGAVDGAAREAAPGTFLRGTCGSLS
jgi:hypothetical protein